MRKTIALLLSAVMLLTSCGKSTSGNDTSANTTTSSLQTSNEITATNSLASTDASEPSYTMPEPVKVENLGFSSLNDPQLHQYINDAIYSDMELAFVDNGFTVENVSCIYKSKEYLDELAFNSQENVYFGYTLSELEQQFEGTKYVFTVNNEGQTTVKAFEAYDNTYDRVIRNVAIGAGVILICVTVSAATGGTASVIMAASAKTATTFALSSGAISGISTALVTGLETGDFDQTVKAAALKASEGFMWGAITGAVAGGASEAYKLKTASAAPKPVDDIPSWQDSESYVYDKYNCFDKQKTFSNDNIKTRPDSLRNIDNHLEAIEVKNYDLKNNNNLSSMCTKLKKELADRLAVLPEDATQRVVLDVRNRNYSPEFLESVKNIVANKISDIAANYPGGIPIDILVA